VRHCSACCLGAGSAAQLPAAIPPRRRRTIPWMASLCSSASTSRSAVGPSTGSKHVCAGSRPRPVSRRASRRSCFTGREERRTTGALLTLVDARSRTASTPRSRCSVMSWSMRICPSSGHPDPGWRRGSPSCCRTSGGICLMPSSCRQRCWRSPSRRTSTTMLRPASSATSAIASACRPCSSCMPRWTASTRTVPRTCFSPSWAWIGMTSRADTWSRTRPSPWARSTATSPR